MSGGKNRRHRATDRKYAADKKMASTMDDLAEFEQFREEILKRVRKDIVNGLSADEIRQKYAAMAAGRTLTIALTEEDSSKALAALKDVQDRAEGKAKERIDHTHKYDKVADDQLDAILMAKLKGTGAENSDSDDVH